MTFIEIIKDIAIPAVKADWAGETVVTDPNALVKGVINTMLIVVVVAAVVYIMMAGIQYVGASGDATKAKTAMAAITNAIIGLIVAFAAYVLVTVVMSNVIGRNIVDIPTPTS
jgi:hypothetical protein